MSKGKTWHRRGGSSPLLWDVHLPVHVEKSSRMNHLGEYVASYGYHVGMGQNSIPLKSDGSYQEFPYFRAILGHSADMAGSPHQTARAGERTDGPWGLPDLASGSLFQVVVGRGLEQVFPRFLTGPPWVLVQYCPLCRLVANRYSTTKRCCLNQKKRKRMRALITQVSQAHRPNPLRASPGALNCSRAYHVMQMCEPSHQSWVNWE